LAEDRGVGVARKADRMSPDVVDLLIQQWGHERPDVDVSAMAVFGRLHRCFDRYRDQIAEVFERHDINMAAFDVLSALRRSGPPYRRTSGELAEQTLVTTGGISLRINRLEAAGLVTRERDPRDGRVVHVTLTEAGLRVVDAVVDDHFRNELRMLAGLTATQRRELAELLSRLERSLELARLQAQHD
jgi:DNA-binding MarR family transcriptional regulator